ncbi:RcnB family protein [Herbaspirillum sp. RV1423]|uniref:RcnB family protein n=1 Tax=Herbaspirillum sp. RV1423 TaxID=1443993 RepID=UPI0004B4DA89|nr:RcnB family protein [Herbaspirillum sp. RV1423]
MNKKSIVSSVLALTLGLGALPVVHAQQYGRDDDRPRHGHDEGRGPPDHRGPPDRRDDHRDDRRGPPGHRDERGAGPNQAFHRGDRLPPEYRNRQYVVDNWRDHHLSAPPRGYHWVQTGGDYVLVAIGTGIILQLFLGN